MNLELIRNYARLITKIGVNIQDGQEVLINADVNDEYFVRLLTEEAYNLGAKYVSVDWSSANVSIIQYKNTNIERLSEVKNWQIEKLKTQCDVLPAVIYLRSTNPDMMKNVDGAKIISVRKSYGNIMKPIKQRMISQTLHLKIIFMNIRLMIISVLIRLITGSWYLILISRILKMKRSLCLQIHSL